jgi:acyl-CoA thioesterase-1
MTTFLVQHITGGDAFFTGLGLLFAAVVLAAWAKWRRTMITSICVFVAVALVAASATPLPWWLYALFGLSVLTWYVLLGGRQSTPSPADVSANGDAPLPESSKPAGHRPLLLTAFLLIMLAVVAVWELRWRWTPSVPLEAGGRLVILGDSVTAGIGEREAVRWTELLINRNSSILVVDRAKMGATVGSVLETLKKQSLGDGVVIIELGGNDLLGSTSLADFERDLDALLKTAARGSRRAIMFELPLPPGYNAWGEVQRRLATAHGVALIPKRRFASILLSQEFTLDSIHLSQAGHEQMADLVAEVLELK